MPERDPEPDLTARLLGAAVGRIGGAPRPGQQRMASAIDQAIVGSRTALIQAGTGTGKSLGYLAPLVAHLASQPDAQAVVATATLALQSQLATKDIPTMVGAASDQVGPLSWCVLKGTSNYPCLLRVRDVPLDPAQFQYSLDDLASPQPVDATAPIAAQVVALRAWAEERAAEQVIADRDDAPGHAGPAWAQVSVGGRECLGPTCPHVGQCFVQAARQRANQAQLVVTNHALVAFEAQRGWSVLRPDVLVVDEAHELAGRVTTALTEELSPQLVDRTVRIAVPALGEELADPLRATAERFAEAVALAAPGRVRDPGLLDAVADLRAGLRDALTALGRDPGQARREQVLAVVRQTHDIAERLALAGDHDVVWVSVRPQYGAQLVVAPLRVAEAIRGTIVDHQTTVLTSATLKLGDSFAPLARAVGLEDQEYDAIDVGSPFDFAAQGICYVAAHLPPPGRDGISQQALVEIADLVQAARGHTLGLFSSMRAAQEAGEFVRRTTGQDLLVQGEGHLPELIARFVATPELSLFGTMSLWQGVDAPGSTCHLVIVDRIPFPRPDEPLVQARQEDVSRQGGNGFMQVAASQAGLLLAQGTGRLIRSTTDQGVVAILDSRLVKARYGPFLMSSMPPLWLTTDRDTVLAALDRLSRVCDTGTADPPATSGS